MEPVLDPHHFTDFIDGILVGVEQFGSLVVPQLQQILVRSDSGIFPEKTGKGIRRHAHPGCRHFQIDRPVEVVTQKITGGFHAAVLSRFQQCFRRQLRQYPGTECDRQQGIVQTIRAAAFQRLPQFRQNGTHVIRQRDHMAGKTRISHAHRKFEMDIELKRDSGTPRQPVAVRRQNVKTAGQDFDSFSVDAQARARIVMMIQTPERTGQMPFVPEYAKFHIPA